MDYESYLFVQHDIGMLVQKRRNYIAYTLELRFFFTNPSI